MPPQKGADRAGLHARRLSRPGGLVRGRGRSVPGRAASGQQLAAARATRHQPHEYVRGGTTKILTLFHPATGQVHLQPVSSCTNPVLHGWLKEQAGGDPGGAAGVRRAADAAATRAAWEAWQDGLAERFTLPDQLPPLRMLLVWDNLTGHKTPRWCSGCAGTASCRSTRRSAAAG
jgi:hypothetical protein